MSIPQRPLEYLAAAIGSAIGGVTGGWLGITVAPLFVTDRGNEAGLFEAIFGSLLGAIVGAVLGSYALLRLLRAQHPWVVARHVLAVFPFGIGLFFALLMLFDELSISSDTTFWILLGITSACVGVVGRALAFVRRR